MDSSTNPNSLILMRDQAMTEGSFDAASNQLATLIKKRKEETNEDFNHDSDVEDEYDYADNISRWLVGLPPSGGGYSVLHCEEIDDEVGVRRNSRSSSRSSQSSIVQARSISRSPSPAPLDLRPALRPTRESNTGVEEDRFENAPSCIQEYTGKNRPACIQEYTVQNTSSCIQDNTPFCIQVTGSFAPQSRFTSPSNSSRVRRRISSERNPTMTTQDQYEEASTRSRDDHSPIDFSRLGSRGKTCERSQAHEDMANNWPPTGLTSQLDDNPLDFSRPVMERRNGSIKALVAADTACRTERQQDRMITVQWEKVQELTPSKPRNYTYEVLPLDMSLSPLIPPLEYNIGSPRIARYDGLNMTTALSAGAVRVLETWYAANNERPYPTLEALERLASDAQITERQAKKWLANRRVQQQQQRAGNVARCDRSTPSKRTLITVCDVNKLQ